MENRTPSESDLEGGFMMFKKSLVILLAAIMTLGLVGCGSSETPKGNDGSTSANPTKEEVTTKEETSESKETTQAETPAETSGQETEAVKEEEKKAFEYSYSENGGEVVLLETDDFRMAATSLKYYESSREKGKWLLRLEVDLENHSDGTVDFDSFNADDMDYCLTGRTVEPNSEKKTSLAFDFENWNNLLGETKDSFLGTYAVRISKHKDDGTIGELLEEVNFDWYASEKSPFANITVGGAEEPTTEEPTTEEPTTEEEYDYFYSDAVIAQTVYYTLKVTYMSRQQNEAGEWEVKVELELTNTYGSRYLTFNPGKQFEGYDPGGDWFEPDETQYISERFKGKDKNELTGKFSTIIQGYNWNGSSASKLFEDIVNFTLCFDKNNPVVNSMSLRQNGY